VLRYDACVSRDLQKRHDKYVKRDLFKSKRPIDITIVLRYDACEYKSKETNRRDGYKSKETRKKIQMNIQQKRPTKEMDINQERGREGTRVILFLENQTESE